MSGTAAVAETVVAIVPAAGTGARMGSDVPKQYLLIGNRTVFEHTLDRLSASPRVSAIVVSLREGDETGAALVEQANNHFNLTVHIAPGGGDRQSSVRNGLQVARDRGLATAADWALVHDAARPCLHSADLERAIEQCTAADGGLLASPLADTIKREALDDSVNAIVAETVPRAGLWRAHTPQVFRFGELETALDRMRAAGITVTDESQAMERIGIRPRLVEGRADNLKITRPDDLGIATALLAPGSDWWRGQPGAIEP